MGRNSSLHVVNISKIFATIFPSTVFMYLLFKISLLSSEWCLRIYINLNLTVQKLQSRAGLWFAWLRKLFYQTGLWPQRICIQERLVSCYIMRLNNYNPCNYHSHLDININFVFKGGNCSFTWQHQKYVKRLWNICILMMSFNNNWFSTFTTNKITYFKMYNCLNKESFIQIFTDIFTFYWECYVLMMSFNDVIQW